MNKLIKFELLSLCFLMVCNQLLAQQNVQSELTIKQLAAQAISRSQAVKNRQLGVEKAKLNKISAYEAYLPKITADVSYTYLNDDIRLPSDLETLLAGTQRLLIKEQTAIAMAGLPIPDAYKVNFATDYKPDASNPNAPGSVLTKAVLDNMKEIPAIQERNILKANVSAQMLLFSGGKIPLTVKVTDYQIQAAELLTEKEKSSVLIELVSVYDKLAVVNKTNEVLNATKKYLDEQTKYVEKAHVNGLTTNLEVQKMKLASQQLESKFIELNSNKQLLFVRLEQLTGFTVVQLEKLLKPQLESWNWTGIKLNIDERKDVKALDNAIIATSYKRKAELTEYMPKIFAFGKKELITKDLSTFDPQWYVGVGVKWTIFDGFSAKNSAQQAKIDQLILENQRDEAKELLTLNLEKVKLEIEKDEKLVNVAKQQVTTSQEAYTITKNQYRNGLISITDFLSGMNDLENAQLEYIKAVYAQRIAVLNLLDATGNLTIENL